jgi:Alpha/beta hydrolase family
LRVIREDSFIPIESKRLAKEESLIVHCRPNSRNENLAVFVHGLGGNRYTSWGSIPKFLFDGIPSMDIGLYDYSSGIRRLRLKNSVSLAKHSKEFADSLRDGGYRNVVLIGHSLGGLLCKAVIKELVDSQARTPYGELALAMISGIFLLATPQAGSRRVPALISPLTADARVLRTHSAFVSEIDERFRDRITYDVGRLPERGRTCIPIYAAVATGDRWVDSLSASLNLSRDQIKNVRGTHSSILAIESPEAGLYPWLAEKIELCINRPRITRIGVVEVLRQDIERKFTEPLGLITRETLSHLKLNIEFKMDPGEQPSDQAP